MIVPLQYKYIIDYSKADGDHYWANGYFCVSKNDLVGYTNAETVTCDLQYPFDSFYNYGVSGYYREEDGTYTLVAADGKAVKGFSKLIGMPGGLFLRADDRLIDWHGNTIFEKVSHVSVTEDNRYIIIQRESGDKPQIYGVDGAGIPAVSGDTNETVTVSDESKDNNAASVQDTESGNAVGQSKDSNMEADSGQEKESEAASGQGTESNSSDQMTASEKSPAQGSESDSISGQNTATGEKADEKPASDSKTETAPSSNADKKETETEPSETARDLIKSTEQLVEECKAGDADFEEMADSILVLLKEAYDVLK